MPERGANDQETIKNLFDTVMKLRKELEYALSHLDDGNMQPNSISADSIKTNTLVVGDNIAMGINAVIAWDNVTGSPTIPTQYTDALALEYINATYIDANGVWTPNVYTQNIVAGTAKISLALIEDIVAENIISNTFITQSLTATKGYIAELTVDQLDTSDKIANYLAGDTSDVNYIKIQNQVVEFITATAVIPTPVANVFTNGLTFTDLPPLPDHTGLDYVVYVTTCARNLTEPVSQPDTIIAYTSALPLYEDKLTTEWDLKTNTGAVKSWKLRVSDMTWIADYNMETTTQGAYIDVMWYDYLPNTRGLTYANYDVLDQNSNVVLAVTDPTTSTPALNRDGQPLYWLDEFHLGLDTVVSAFPAYTYVYNELTKFKWSFELYNGTYIPQLTLGAGAGNTEFPDWGKGFIYKETDGLLLRYVKRLTGENVDLRIGETGITGVTGGGVASAFTDLTDAPGSYVGSAKKIVAVNITENALEFIEASSGIVINPNHIFVDNIARDNYFTTNPTELVIGIYISVGTGFQQWDGTVWLDKTAVVTGPQGIQGVGVTKQWINFWTGLPVTGSSAQLSKAAYIVPQQEIKLSGVSSCVNEAAGKTFKFTVCELNSSGVQQGEALYDSGNIVSLGNLNYTRKMTSELTLEVGKYYVVSITNTTSGGIFAKTSIASNNIKDVISGISGFATYNGNPADGVMWAITAGTTTLAFGMLIEI